LKYQEQKEWNCIFVSPSFGVAGALDLDGVLSLLLLDKPHLSHLDLLAVSGAVNK